MSLNEYRNIFTSVRWSTKDYKDIQILAIIGVAQKLAYDSNKLSEKSNNYNRKSTRGERAYTRYLPH